MSVRVLLVTAACFSSGVAYSDVLTLRNGTTVQGGLLSADANEIRWKAGQETKSYPLGDVAAISFDARNAAPAPATPPAMRLPPGAVSVRTIDKIDSKTAQLGQTFKASLNQPLHAGELQLPRGSDVVLKLVESRSAGRLRGSASLSVMLVSVSSGGKVYEANSESVTIESGSKGKGSAAKIGVGTGAGALLGGVLGGKRGAAIGAGAGAGAGTAVALATGPQVHIPAETILTYQVE